MRVWIGQPRTQTAIRKRSQLLNAEATLQGLRAAKKVPVVHDTETQNLADENARIVVDVAHRH